MSPSGSMSSKFIVVRPKSKVVFCNDNKFLTPTKYPTFKVIDYTNFRNRQDIKKYIQTICFNKKSICLLKFHIENLFSDSSFTKKIKTVRLVQQSLDKLDKWTVLYTICCISNKLFSVDVFYTVLDITDRLLDDINITLKSLNFTVYKRKIKESQRPAESFGILFLRKRKIE